MKRIVLKVGLLILLAALLGGAWWVAAKRKPAPVAGPSPRTAHRIPGVPAAGFPQPVREFIEARCIDCHDSETSKGGLNFESLTAELDSAPIEARWTLIFDRVERGEMPPKKKAQPAPSERAAFMASLGDVLRQHDTAQRAETGRVAWRRLNRFEYENTVRDLLAIDTPLAELLPEDGAARGFDTVSEGLRLSAAQIESYLQAADAALDDAIDLQPRPERRTLRHEFRESPQMQEALAVVHGSLRQDGTRNEQVLRALPDAVVMFVNQAHRATLIAHRAERAGLYRVRLSAYGFQNQRGPTVVARLMITDLASYRLAAAFDLEPDTPRLIETTVRLEKGEMFTVAAAGCGLAADGSSVRTVGGPDFTGSGLALQWAEIEGPLVEAWPPPSVARVFGPLPVQPLADPARPDRAYALPADASPEAIDRALAAFARRAFRRPVADADTARYRELARQALAQGAGQEAALRRALKAILASPEFLFLRETPGPLDDFALAARLSYFLWSTMPDDELQQLAGQGKLRDPAVLRAQTERLLTSPRARAFVENFCGQWLSLRNIAATMPDRRLYPEFDDLLQLAMVRETESFFQEMLRADRGVSTLIDSDFTMLNSRLADHYGIPGVKGEHFRPVPLPPGSRRGGILTHASILKVTANGTLTSPVVRGAWVMKHLLGRETQPPPADAGTIEPDTRGATTIREQLARHRRAESCAGCHDYIDPAGFALESYDVIGGWRDTYRVRKGKPVFDPFTRQKQKYGNGLPVDPSGELADGRKFADLEQLKKHLLAQPDVVARHLVGSLLAYATGAGVTFSDRAQVEAILAHTQPPAYPLRSLIHAIVQSPLFLTK